MRPTRTPTRIALAAALGTGLLLTGGVGAAMAGALPGAAQDRASEVLAALGVEVPGADEHSGEHADDRGRSADRAPATDDEMQEEAAIDSVEEATAGRGKGEEISRLARETEAEGVEKGAEISGLASDGRSQAGQHGRPDTAGSTGKGKPADPGGQAPVETPHGGGNAKADEASGGKSSGAPTSGTDKADEASGGRSGAGADNRP